MYIISGCNGSGKTTASYSLLPSYFNCSDFVNSDEFAKSLSPFNPSAASVTAGRYMIMKMKWMMQHGKDFCVETTLATRSLLISIKEAQKLGYYVTLMYLWLNSPDLAIKRVRARVAAGGHNIPDDVIRRRYGTGLRYFFDEYMQLCDKWILADNSIIPFTVIADGTQQGQTVLDSLKYELIWSQAHPAETEMYY